MGDNSGTFQCLSTSGCHKERYYLELFRCRGYGIVVALLPKYLSTPWQHTRVSRIFNRGQSIRLYTQAIIALAPFSSFLATFDFTLLFEETILSILPSAVLLLLIPPRILQLWKTPHKVISSYLLTTKIVSCSACFYKMHADKF
jgi:hypothetical protein